MLEGTKEILGYAIAPKEPSEMWKEILQDMKTRGAERVSLLCTDGLSGMENASRMLIRIPMSKGVWCTFKGTYVPRQG